MILEIAILQVVPGREAAFEAAFAEARPLIARQKGHVRNALLRSVESRPGRYLLQVWWETLTDHTEGFRGSADYQEWKRLLHHFYDPFPEVEHYALD
ncbi:antibiotic biosynthesis monooxygenase family protein [Arenibaculum pallidiluteum]|uniref:antibiotic biosynthesis monooxygenase family protein n=1 Tax=Arenibaculum pallidiluteum TaxID=2812559 RepID=UPI001A97B5A1|nr:antibiotic biosynthesis monooxygenase [Arenibaculum pallidiluteum]